MADGQITRNGATIEIDDNGGVIVEPASGENITFQGDDTGTNAVRDSLETGNINNNNNPIGISDIIERLGVTKGSTTTLYQALDDDDNGGFQSIAQPTDDVGTSAKPILNTDLAITSGMMIFVVGTNQSSSSRFYDVLTYFRAGQQVSVKFSEELETPDSRTYSASGGQLELAMGDNTYDVAASAIGSRRDD